MRIAVVGPTHPFKGGVAQHTTAMTHELIARGHDVTLVSWASQYPEWLYPGQMHVHGPSELPLVPDVRRRLHWARPWTWLSEGRHLRRYDRVVVAHVTPVQVPVHLVLAALAGRRRTVVVCHNVLPHERFWWDRPLVCGLLRSASVVVVHSSEQAATARELGTPCVVTASLPVFHPTDFVRRDEQAVVHRRVLFFGLVRHYKGLDVLLRALALGPSDLRLRVAGEFWDDEQPYRDLVRELGLADRVELRTGYVPAAVVPSLFADVDALVLPYRSATGSQGPWTAFEFGVPAVVTDVDALAGAVRPGTDGLVVPVDDVPALALALGSLYEGDRLAQMRAHVHPADASTQWDAYLRAVVGD